MNLSPSFPSLSVWLPVSDVQSVYLHLFVFLSFLNINNTNKAIDESTKERMKKYFFSKKSYIFLNFFFIYVAY